MLRAPVNYARSLLRHAYKHCRSLMQQPVWFSHTGCLRLWGRCLHLTGSVEANLLWLLLLLLLLLWWW